TSGSNSAPTGSASSQAISAAAGQSTSDSTSSTKPRNAPISVKATSTTIITPSKAFMRRPERGPGGSGIGQHDAFEPRLLADPGLRALRRLAVGERPDPQAHCLAAREAHALGEYRFALVPEPLFQPTGIGGIGEGADLDHP